MSEIKFKNHKEEFDRSCPLCDVIKVDGQLYVHISKVEAFQTQLQQKENIIKEVREYIERYRKNKEKLQGVFLCSSKLLEILDKVSDE